MAETAQAHAPDGSLKVDMFLWINKTTMDIIGHAGNGASIITVVLELNVSILPGFNHPFGFLQQAGSPELIETFRRIISFNPLRSMFAAIFPPVRKIVCHSILIVMEPTSLAYR
jgi:hypothetical protein